MPQEDGFWPEDEFNGMQEYYWHACDLLEKYDLLVYTEPDMVDNRSMLEFARGSVILRQKLLLGIPSSKLKKLEELKKRAEQIE
tara:strand:- start:225 stop:476 length:252 start_codon:yes stop_codon:yes gene_type:complete